MTPLQHSIKGQIIKILPILSALLFAISGAYKAQAATAPTALLVPEQRVVASLDGEWHYIVDPMKMGFRDGRMRNFRRDQKQREQELIEYDWDSAPTLSIPGDWNSQIDELLWYEGMVWFRRVFAKPDLANDSRQFIQFGAVNYRSHIYLNGELLGTHEGGFTPFSFEVTGLLKDGANSLVVGADSEHLPESVPAQQVDWWNYGGITRSVALLSVPPTFIRSHDIQMQRDGRIRLSAQLDGPAAANAQVTFAIPALGSNHRGTTDADGILSLTIDSPRGLRRWSPEQPMLYDVQIGVNGRQRISDRIGFRTIETQGAQILLNGAPVFMRGIAMHEEAIGKTGTRAIDREAARALLNEAKALGANFVRLAHYPHDPQIAELADEMGLMVWSEIPVYWDMAFANKATLTQARLTLAEMMTRDRNRASIVIWSVGNETPETPERLQFMRRLIDDVRARDPHRLVSAALHDDADTSSGKEGRVTVDDEIGNYLDVLAMNRYEAWYGYRTPPQIDEVNWTVPHDKPLIFSEFGAGALHGFRTDPSIRWSEDYQADLFRYTFKMAERIPNLAGTSPWLLKDFRSPRRFHGTYQNYWNRKGLIDPEGKRKLGWQVVRDWYAKKAAE